MPGFLDTSALAKLYHVEVGSEFVEALLRRDSPSYISTLTLVEMQSVWPTRFEPAPLHSMARKPFD
jgi:uncharacterized protein with PIN domain